MNLYGKLTAKVMDEEGKIKDVFVRDNTVINTGENHLANFLATVTNAEYPMKWMAIGTGTVAVGETDTKLAYEVGTRVTGVKSNPSTNIYRVVATFLAGNPSIETAITELGLFNQLAVGGTELNRLVFGTITKGANDQIEFTLDITIE